MIDMRQLINLCEAGVPEGLRVFRANDGADVTNSSSYKFTFDGDELKAAWIDTTTGKGPSSERLPVSMFIVKKEGEESPSHGDYIPNDNDEVLYNDNGTWVSALIQTTKNGTLVHYLNNKYPYGTLSRYIDLPSMAIKPKTSGQQAFTNSNFKK